jgi:hypothetical protein
MANFRGGFAFNNEAAKVEVEQAPDGTLISCVNPVTGESLGGDNRTETINATMANPFAGYEHEFDLFGLNAKANFSGYIQADLTPLGGGVITMPFSVRQVGYSIEALYGSPNQGNNPFMIDFVWVVSNLPDTHVEIYTADVLNEGQYVDAEPYASNITTITTIYYHPMP